MSCGSRKGYVMNENTYGEGRKPSAQGAGSIGLRGVRNIANKAAPCDRP